MFDTAKTIFTQRNRAIIASFMLAASSFAYNITIKAIANTDGYLMIAIAAVGSGIGCFLAIKLANRFFRELGVRVLLSDDKETMQELRDFMASYHITNIAVDSYKHGSWTDKSITLIAFLDSREKDRLITEYVRGLRGEGKKVKDLPGKKQ